MADLSGKLRIMGAWFESDGWIANAAIANGGADEITRLRSDLAEWQQAASVEAGLRREFSEKLEIARKALEEIDRQYENHDLSHKDFRIGAKVVTDAALTEIAH